MNQGLVILFSAILVGLLSLAVLCAYTNVKASKMPEQNEMIQIFISGAIVASFIAWLVTSGLLHGNSLYSMITSDVSSAVKSIDSTLKGGDESVVKAVTFEDTPAIENSSNVSKKISSAVNIPAISGMVGGFFKSMGLDSNVLQELSVGIPSF